MSSETDRRKQKTLEACYRLLDETGDCELCLQLYPDLADEIRAHIETHQLLIALAPPDPDPVATATGRRWLLSSLAQRPPRRSVLARLTGPALSGWLVALSMLSVVAVVGVSASTTGTPHSVNVVLDELHITHSDDNQQAASTSTPVIAESPGAPRSEGGFPAP